MFTQPFFALPLQKNFEDLYNRGTQGSNRIVAPKGRGGVQGGEVMTHCFKSKEKFNSLMTKRNMF
jgi:hypothetical protein